MTNEQLYLILGGQIFNLVTVLWIINRGDKSINLRIDDIHRRLDDMNKHFDRRFDDMSKHFDKRFDDLKDLIKSEMRRPEKKSILD